jgi:hypothetical protein
MKAPKRRKRGRPKAVLAVAPRRAGAADEMPDVSWHDEKTRALMLWGEQISTDYSVQPESAEEE